MKPKKKSSFGSRAFRSFRGLFFAFIISVPVFGESHVWQTGQGNISGIIRDQENNEPLPFANVELLGLGYGKSSDNNGTFYISNLPSGNVTLKISYMGYQPFEKTIMVEEGKT